MKLLHSTKPDSINLNIKKLSIAIVTSQFNRSITEALTQGALDAFLEVGGEKDQLSFFEVPGAFELPVVAKKAAQTKKYDAILCLGAVIKGETAHFDYVASSAIQGISQVAIETEVPVMCGVLTTHTLKQAQDRACEELNIGCNCLYAALTTLEALEQID